LIQLLNVLKPEAMKSLVLTILISALYISCKKNNPQINTSSVLTSHLWYPYKAEIITTDTNTITTHDSSGIPHTQTTVKNMDTTILLNECLQNSRFKFQENGILNVSNPCNIQNATIDTIWSISQNNFLTAVSINDTATNGYYFRLFNQIFGYAGPIDTTYNIVAANGLITQINNSEFVFNNIIILSTSDISSVHSDTLTKIESKEYTTYKIR
jgi:hypothetical protein